MSDVRIAVVQHGDYAEAIEIIGRGQPEPYFGMRYSLEVLDKLLRGRMHMVVSLSGAAYDIERGDGRLVGLPRPRTNVSRLSGTFGMLEWARQINRKLDDFRRVTC